MGDQSLQWDSQFKSSFLFSFNELDHRDHLTLWLASNSDMYNQVSMPLIRDPPFLYYL